MSSTRVSLVGGGKVAGIHADALAELPEAEFVAACDVSAERAEQFAAKHRVRPFTDLATMLREASPEAIIIGTPHPLHAKAAIRAAEAGVHVLVEKPLAANLADCDAMLAAARKSGVTLGVISQRRFFEAGRRMKAALDAGQIWAPGPGGFLGSQRRGAAAYPAPPWRPWACSSATTGATPPTTSPTRGAAGGTPRAAGSWSTNPRTNSTSCCGSWARPPRCPGTGPTSTTRPSRWTTRPWPPSGSPTAA